MDYVSSTIHHAYIAVSELPWAGYESLRHQSVCLQEVIDRIRIERLYRLVGRMCALDLVDLALRPRYALASENGRYLRLGQRVPLDCRGAANRANVVYLSKPHAIRAFEDDSVPFDGGGDFGDQIHRLAAHLIRRNVFSSGFHNAEDLRRPDEITPRRAVLQQDRKNLFRNVPFQNVARENARCQFTSHSPLAFRAILYQKTSPQTISQNRAASISASISLPYRSSDRPARTFISMLSCSIQPRSMAMRSEETCAKSGCAAR